MRKFFFRFLNKNISYFDTSLNVYSINSIKRTNYRVIPKQGQTEMNCFATVNIARIVYTNLARGALISTPSLAYIKQAMPFCLLVLKPKMLINLVREGGKRDTPNWNRPKPNDTAPISLTMVALSITGDSLKKFASYVIIKQ